MIDKVAFGKGIAQKMDKEGVTIHDMAKELNITTKAVRNYLNGINLPSTENLCKICSLLKTELKDIMIMEENIDERL